MASALPTLTGGHLRMRGSRRSGMTLVDVIATMVLIGIAVPPTMIALRDAAQRQTENFHRIAARWLAAEQIETILSDRHHPARSYAHVATGSYPSDAFGAFTRTTTITEVANDLSTAQANSGIKRVTVRVSWSGTQGERALQLSTVVTNYTP
jgi:type II secretory pathway pseudopilin PulG